MTIDDFWKIIETAGQKGSDADDIAKKVLAALKYRSASEIRAFDEHQRHLMEKSYNWDLWGAAYLINGGCSDDCFEYFRSWLFTKGRQVFESTITTPDSLASHVEKDEKIRCEDFMYTASTAYEAVSKSPLEGSAVKYPELGESWDFDSAQEMSKRYPKLWEKFGW